MSLGFMVEKRIGLNTQMLVDLGYISDKKTQEHHKELLEFGIGSKNFNLEGFSRLLMRVPKSKEKILLEKFPIKEGSIYWQTTHHWEEG